MSLNSVRSEVLLMVNFFFVNITCAINDFKFPNIYFLDKVTFAMLSKSSCHNISLQDTLPIA